MYPIIACDAVWSLMSSSLTAFRERGRVTATGRCGGWPTGAGRGREAGSMEVSCTDSACGCTGNYSRHDHRTSDVSSLSSL